MFGAIAGGIASALAGGAMSKLFGGGQKAASGGIQGDAASNLFLSLILHLGNLFLIVQLHFSKLFLILKSGVNHTSRGSISTSTLPSIKLRKCSSKIDRKSVV